MTAAKFFTMKWKTMFIPSGIYAFKNLLFPFKEVCWNAKNNMKVEQILFFYLILLVYFTGVYYPKANL